MTKQTEKRPAKVGERILITNKMTGETRYKNGDIGEVLESSTDAGVFANINGRRCGLWSYEYEVIIENENGGDEMSAGIIEKLQAAVAELKAKVEALEVGKNGDIFTAIAKHVHPNTKTSQQQRDEIVAKAKRDVEALKNDYGHYDVKKPGSSLLRSCNVEFFVNGEKRTVVALLKGFRTGEVRAKGIAKCAPNDCFNAAIGRAIALRRALGLPVPSEYLQAPQPTEVRVGDVVKVTEPGAITGKTMKVTELVPSLDSARRGKAFKHSHDKGWLGAGQVSIIDDSRANVEQKVAQ